MNSVRIGVIGIGNMGSAHAKGIYDGKVSQMVLTAVCDVDEERLVWAEENFGQNVLKYQDYKEMLQSKVVDAVLIATPHICHPMMAKAAFEAGLHVLTEKPAGVDAVSVRAMNKAAEDSGKIFGIMYNQRTNSLYHTLKMLVAEGKLGEIKRFVWVINNWYRTQAYYDSSMWRATWSGEGGGVLLNQCPHNLDIWQWIMGMPVKLRAFCKYGNYHDIVVEDDVTIYAEYENHASAVFITSTGEYPGTNRLEISGTKGKAVIEDGILKLYLLEQDEREICFQSKEGMPQESFHVEKVNQEVPEPGHIGILQNFADAICRGKELIAPGKEGINGLILSNAAYLSDWTDEWVYLPMDEQRFLDELEKKREQEGVKSRAPVREKVQGEYIGRWAVRW